MVEHDAKMVRFGGRGYRPLPWNPLPFMDQYLGDLTSHPLSYTRPVKVGLAHFAAFTSGVGIVHPEEITRSHMLRFQAALMTTESERGIPLSSGYQRQLMKYVRAWLAWLTRLGYITTDPWIGIKLGASPKRPRPLDDSEIADLFAGHRTQAFAIPPFAFHRREVILVLLFGWGMRLHELQGLNVSKLAFRTEHVPIRDHYGRTRSMPYDAVMWASVQRWLSVRPRHAAPGEDALLIDQTGGRLGIPRIREIVIECGLRSGVTISPQRLQDTVHARLVDTAVPTARIADLLMGQRPATDDGAHTLAKARTTDDH